MATPKLSSSHLITRAVTTRGFLFRSGLPIGASCYPSQFVSGTRVPRQRFGGRGTDHLQSSSGGIVFKCPAPDIPSCRPSTTQPIAAGTPLRGYREFRIVSGNGPEWLTFPLRACVATGRAHCAVEPQEPPRAMQASEVFLLRL